MSTPIIKISDDSYRIYLGTFETRKLAQSCSDKLFQWRKQSLVQDHKFSPKDTWYRVTLGNFDSKKEALETVDYLQEQGIIHIP